MHGRDMIQADHHVNQHRYRDGRTGNLCKPDRERSKKGPDNDSGKVVDPDPSTVEFSQTVAHIEREDGEDEVHLIIWFIMHVVFHRSFTSRFFLSAQEVKARPPPHSFRCFWQD